MPAPSADTAGRINQYALVAYIDGKLGDFLFHLRQEIVPSCRLRSHVSILPPRQLPATESEAIECLHFATRNHYAFAVTLGEIEVFPVTNVVYIAVANGLPELHAMHGSLNTGALQYSEPFQYHPHITLAQEIPAQEHAEVHKLCLARWAEYKGPREFPVETLTFVQNTLQCGWLDLAETRLAMAASRL